MSATTTATTSISYGSQAWTNFINVLGNKETLTGYSRDISQYIGFLKLQDPAKLLKGTAEQQKNQTISIDDYWHVEPNYCPSKLSLIIFPNN